MSDMVLSDELQEFADNLRRFLADCETMDAVRSRLDDGADYDGDIWRRLCTEFELSALSIPEEHGGSGFGMLETAVVSRELGRSLLPSRYFSTVVLAAGALLESGDTEAQQRLLPRIVSGELAASLAFQEERPQRGDLAVEPTTAVRQGDGWVLTGRKVFVVDADLADVLVVSAVSEEGLTLFLVDVPAAGVTIEPLTSIDASRRRATVDLTAVSARPLGVPGEGQQVLDRTLDRGFVALSAEAAGGMEALVEMTVDYAKTREQFGRPIGDFQAVKHMCTDLLEWADAGWASAIYAAAAVDNRTEDAALASVVTQAHAAEAYPRAAAQAIQVHGGIGFTWEHDAHLYYRRARDSATLLSSPRDLYLTVADRTGL